MDDKWNPYCGKRFFGILRSTAVTCIQFLGVDFNLWDIYVCSLKSPFRKYLLPALDVMWKNLDCIHQHEDLNLVRYIHFATISIYVTNFWSQFQPLRDICLLPLESLQKVFALHIWLTTHTIEEMGKLQLAFMMIPCFHELAQIILHKFLKCLKNASPPKWLVLPFKSLCISQHSNNIV